MIGSRIGLVLGEEVLCEEDGEADEDVGFILHLIKELADTHTLVQVGIRVVRLELVDEKLDGSLNNAEFVFKQLRHLEA